MTPDELTTENQALTAELTEAGVPIKPIKEDKNDSPRDR